MLEKEFDRFVTDRFRDHQSPVPGDMWKRIMGADDKDRKAFFFWKWYFVIPTILVICLLIAYYMFAYYMLVPGGKMKVIHDTEMHSKGQVINDSGERSGQNPEKAVVGGAKAGWRTEGGRKAEDSAVAGGGLPAGMKESVDGRGLSAGEKVDAVGGAKTGSPAIAEEEAKAEKRKSAVERKIVGKRKLALRKTGAGGELSAGKQNGAGGGMQGPKKARKPGKSDNVSDKDIISETEGALMQLQERHAGSPMQEKNADLQKNDLSVVGSKGGVLKKDSTNIKNQQSLKKMKVGKDSLAKKIVAKQNDELPKVRKKGLLHDKPWYIELYVSPDLPFTSQRTWLSYSGGGRLSKMLTRHFSASIGLQYSRINLKHHLDTMNFYPAFYFKNFDIPFLIGYETGNAHFRTVLHTGLIFNVHTCPDGEFYNPVLKHYPKNTGISLYMGLGLIGKLNERVSLFTEPYFRLQLSSRGSPTVLYSQRLDVGGLNIGLRYDLKKGVKH